MILPCARSSEKKWRRCFNKQKKDVEISVMINTGMIGIILYSVHYTLINKVHILVLVREVNFE